MKKEVVGFVRRALGRRERMLVCVSAPPPEEEEGEPVWDTLVEIGEVDYEGVFFALGKTIGDYLEGGDLGVRDIAEPLLRGLCRGDAGTVAYIAALTSSAVADAYDDDDDEEDDEVCEGCEPPETRKLRPDLSFGGMYR